MEVDNKILAKYLAEVRRVEKSRSEDAEKEIRKLYKKLLKDLNGFVGEYYTKYSDDDGILSAAILQQKAKYAAFLEEVDKNIREITPQVSKTIRKTVEDTYKACYKGMVNAFTGTVDEEKVKESFKGLSIKPEVIKAAVENPISGLTLPERLEKNRKEVVYDIKQNITNALMTGERYDTTAKKIAERLDINYGKAVRIVRTESHRVQEKGLMDGAEEIGEKVRDDGLVYAVIWRNMGDNKVRPYSRVHTSKGWKTYKSKTHADHVKMEGQIIEAGGYFDLGHGVKAKSPGESGDAANDINCRCFIEYEMMTKEEFKERGGKLKEDREKVGKEVVKEEKKEYNESEHTESYNYIMRELEDNNVEYNKVQKLSEELTEHKIIKRLSGGNMTEGSCSSLAFSYIGNKNGLDVIDFRGGKSQYIFSHNSIIEKIGKFEGVKSKIIKVKKEIPETIDIIKGLEYNKEYYIAAGKHAAIIRNTVDGPEYLELQSAINSGWTSFEKNRYGSISNTLNKRFGCKSTAIKRKLAGKTVTIERSVILMDMESFKGNVEFTEILGYINTATDKQKKGVLGNVK